MAEPESAAEVAAFEQWLARDPANPRAYAEMEDLARAAGNARPSRTVPAGHLRRSLVKPALAFSLLAAVVATAVLMSQATAEPAFAAVANDGPAVRGVRLTDGTVVWLDVGARIGVRLDKGHRDIAVREGKVRIVPGTGDQPLKVSAGGVVIEPGVTQLDVTAQRKVITVAALDGAVTLMTSPGGMRSDHTRLERGKAIEIGPGGYRRADIDRAWPAGRLNFASEPLLKILALANRQGEPDVIVDDPELAAMRISGVFDLRDTRGLARKLAAVLDLQIEETPSGLRLHR